MTRQIGIAIAGDYGSGPAIKEAVGDLERFDEISQKAAASVERLANQRTNLKQLATAYKDIAAQAATGSDEQLIALKKVSDAEARLAAQVKETGSAMATSNVRAKESAAGLGSMTKEARGGIASFTGLGRAMFFASNAFLGGALIGGALKSIVDKTRNTDLAMTQLRTGVKDAGSSWALMGGQIEATLKKEEELSQFTRVDLATGLNKLILSTGSVTKGERELAIATDLARLKNEDLATATQQVAQAGLGHTTVLRGLQIAIPPVTTAHDALKNELAQLKAKHEALTPAELAHANALAKTADQAATGARALDILTQKTSGADAAFSKSGAGGLARFQRSLEDLEVSLGRELMPELTKGITDLSNWIDRMNKSGKAQRDMKEAVDALTTAIKLGKDAIQGIDNVTGSFKHTLELLLAIKAAAWAGGVAGSIQKLIGSAKALTGLAGAEAEAGGLLGTLGKLKALGPIAITLAVTELFNQHQQSNTLSNMGAIPVIGGTLLGHHVGDKPFYLPSAHERGRLEKIYGQTYFVPTGGGAGGRNPSPLGGGFRNASLGGGPYNAQQLEALWIQAGGNPAMAPLMAQIALSESSGNPLAHNASGASGLWQILGQPVKGNVYNPLVNARNAVAKLSSQGLGAWAASMPAWSKTAAYAAYLASGGTGSAAGYAAANAGAIAGKPKKPAIVSGKDEIPPELAAQITRAAKLAHETQGEVALEWVANEADAIKAARKALEDKPKGQSGKQAKATQREIDALGKQLDNLPVVSGAHLLPQSLQDSIAKFRNDARDTTGKAAENDLKQERVELERAVAVLKGELVGAKGKQAAAIRKELDTIDGNIATVNKEIASNLKAQAAAIKSNAASAISSAKQGISQAFSQIIADADQAFENATQAYITDTLGPEFFQGMQNPLEAQLAAMQAADTANSLADALAQAKAQLAADQGAGADAATIANDKKAIAQAQRAIDENNLAIQATELRRQEDSDYAAAVKQWEQERSLDEKRMNTALEDLSKGIQDGTATIDGKGGLNDVLSQFGLSVSSVADDDMATLADATKVLARVFADEAVALATAGDLAAAQAAKRRADALGLTQPPGAGGGGYPHKPPPLAAGGDIRAEGLAYLHRGERVLPAAEVTSPAGGGMGDIYVTVNAPHVTDTRSLEAMLKTPRLQEAIATSVILASRGGHLRRGDIRP